MPPVFRRHWFLLLLAAVLAVGIGGHAAVAPLADGLPSNWIIGSVLLAMALPMEMRSIGATLRRPGPALLATAINFLLVPALAWGASRLLTADLAVGLIVASAVPCTLASAAVWTRLAGGNDSVSLLVTMFTNLSCFVVTPAIIYLLAGKSGVEIEFSEMALKLLLLIVLPIVAAQLLRLIAPVGRWAAANKQLLSTYAQLGILSIVLVGAVRCGERIAALEGELSGVAGQVLLMLVLVAAIHLVAWWAGLRTAAALGMARADQLAVAFAGSQKTLMVGLAIALEFGGLAALPMLAYHVEQLLVDTVLAGRARNGAESITP